jgi:two-component system cell cycle sensor histidine kinase/response regulator CckA
MPTLLVVDDEHSVRRFVKEAMARRGWLVVGAASVDAALAISMAEPIDVALCDIVMPHAGGPEFARAWQSRPSHPPLILMTGNPAARALFGQPLPASTMPVPMLEKPFKISELEVTLERALRLRRSTEMPGRAAS